MGRSCLKRCLGMVGRSGRVQCRGILLGCWHTGGHGIGHGHLFHVGCGGLLPGYLRVMLGLLLHRSSCRSRCRRPDGRCRRSRSRLLVLHLRSSRSRLLHVLPELLLRVHRRLVVMDLLLLIGWMGHKNRCMVDLRLCHSGRNQMLLLLLLLLLLKLLLLKLLLLLMLWLLVVLLLLLLLNLLLLKRSRCRWTPNNHTISIYPLTAR